MDIVKQESLSTLRVFSGWNYDYTAGNMEVSMQTVSAPVRSLRKEALCSVRDALFLSQQVLL